MKLIHELVTDDDAAGECSAGAVMLLSDLSDDDARAVELRSAVLASLGRLPDKERQNAFVNHLVNTGIGGSVAELCAAALKVAFWYGSTVTDLGQLLALIQDATTTIWSKQSVDIVTQIQLEERKQADEDRIERAVEWRLIDARRRAASREETRRRRSEQEWVGKLIDRFCHSLWGERVRGLGYKACLGCHKKYADRRAMRGHMARECAAARRKLAEHEWQEASARWSSDVASAIASFAAGSVEAHAELRCPGACGGGKYSVEALAGHLLACEAAMGRLRDISALFADPDAADGPDPGKVAPA